LKEEHRLRVLREIFGSEKAEITGPLRKLHKEEFYDLHCSLNIVRAIKSRRVRWTGNVARMGERCI
jgi:hypothetical protein